MFSFSFSNTNGTQSPIDSIRRCLASKLKVFGVDKDLDIPKSPLQHLLESNASPSDSDIITIRALISDAKYQIEELDRLPFGTRASQAIESQLLKLIETHQALLSPIRYIPSEILQEIFIQYAKSRFGESLSLFAKMPWRLGHVSHRWREIALSLPCLWDNIPEICDGQGPLLKRSSVRAFTCLIQRSRASPTLIFRIHQPFKIIKHPIISTIILHSERIQRLYIDVIPKTIQKFQGLKGRLPNLRDLHLILFNSCLRSVDLFKTAPALRQVTITGPPLTDSNVRILLPWSQITHFRAWGTGVGLRLSWLCSLVFLHIDQHALDHLIPSRKPTTLPHLCALEIILRDRSSCKRNACDFLEYLTIPAIEVIKIVELGSLVPCLAVMLSRSQEPSRLRKLSFRSTPLQPGELSTLLELTPQLIELDIPVLPVHDIQRLISHEGEHMLVPMLQALYMHDCEPIDCTQAEYFNNLAQVRCESGGKDSEDAIMQNTLDTLHINFKSYEYRDDSQKTLNNWVPLFNRREVKAVKMLHGFYGATHRYRLDELAQVFTHIEKCKAITDGVLRETHVHNDLRRSVYYFNSLRMPPDDIYNLKQRVMNILDRWDQLLLNSLDDYCWARIFPDLCNRSLAYVAQDKRTALKMSPDALDVVYGLKIEKPCELSLDNMISSQAMF